MEKKIEESTSKTQLKINLCTHRRLNIEHQFGEQLRKQNYLSNQNFHRHREQTFHRKLNQFKKTFDQTESHPIEQTDDDQSMLLPNYSTRIQNHCRLLNLSTETEKRLLNGKSSHHLPAIPSRRNSLTIDQSQPSKKLPINPRLQSYFNQQMSGEQDKQLKNDQRKAYLLKEFDELKHTIEDPHSAFSVLAALSRAILFLDSGTE